MRPALLAVLLAAAPAGAAASAFGSQNAGTSAATFLTLGADARAAGMGNAVSASADDASGAYWNPADLARLRYRHATLTHAASYQDTFFDFLAYAQPIDAPRGEGRARELPPEQLGTIAAALLYQNAGRISEVDNTGTPTGGSFTPQDIAAILAWGSTIDRHFDVGISVKYVQSKIEATAGTGAADFGARWRTYVPGTEIGYALAADARNVGGPLKFRDAADPLPLTLVLGQALRPFSSLTLDLDVVMPRDAPVYESVGAEWRAPMTEDLSGALRVGYDGRLDSGALGGTTGIALGAGLGFRRLAFDYAWTPAGGLGDVSRLSMSYRF
ncbi:MAG: PorV/PorQ family protein [Elusimicrobia bacterium]|nr:PorV/PorQ family protein [Elusimicrobiota bacterium]